jgi:hypothetical protein
MKKPQVTVQTGPPRLTARGGPFRCRCHRDVTDRLLRRAARSPVADQHGRVRRDHDDRAVGLQRVLPVLPRASRGPGPSPGGPRAAPAYSRSRVVYQRWCGHLATRSSSRSSGDRPRVGRRLQRTANAALAEHRGSGERHSQLGCSRGSSSSSPRGGRSRHCATRSYLVSRSCPGAVAAGSASADQLGPTAQHRPAAPRNSRFVRERPAQLSETADDILKRIMKPNDDS